MKNFPHQISDLEKLYSALGIVRDLAQDGKDVSDDGVLGKALARERVYTFRDKTLNIAQALKRENLKPRANRGTETAARDIRRFFQLAGLIVPAARPSHFKVTKAARDLLSTASGEARVELWREALLALALEDEYGRVSHPYRLLLRLVSDAPEIETSKLMLALEARDDSEAEYDRVLRLAKKDVKEILVATAISEAGARNAVKILPALARQLDDIYTIDGQNYVTGKPSISEDGLTSSPDEFKHAKTIAKKKASVGKEVSAADIGALPNFSDDQDTIVNLSEAISIRKQRTLLHQKAVKSLGEFLEAEGFTLHINPFDCVAFSKTKGCLLFEVKSLDGSPADERQQAERAVGQLCAYTFFDLPSDFRHDRFRKVAAFTHKPSAQIVDFLEANDITVIWLDENTWVMRTNKNKKLGTFSPTGFLEV